MPTVMKCLRCGYEWMRRAPGIPKNCAKRTCNSPYWNKPRMTPAAAVKTKPEEIRPMFPLQKGAVQITSRKPPAGAARYDPGFDFS